MGLNKAIEIRVCVELPEGRTATGRQLFEFLDGLSDRAWMLGERYGWKVHTHPSIDDPEFELIELERNRLRDARRRGVSEWSG